MMQMPNPIDWGFDLPLKDERELRHFVKKAWGVTIPDVQVCPNHCSPWRAFADAYFATSPIAVWKASRGMGGKSFMLAVLALTEAVTLKADVNVLGGSGEQSENVHFYAQGLWFGRSAPRALLASDPAKRHTRLIWGNAIRALMASQKSVRGPHPQRLRLDEIDEMELDIFDSAMGQTMSARGIRPHTVCSSTHQYADGTMTLVLERAARKGWPVWEWCFRESLEPHGWLAESEIAIKRLQVTAAMWSVEYEGQEPSPESRAIMPEKVAELFDESLGEFDGDIGEYIEIEQPIYRCQICGVDVGADDRQELFSEAEDEPKFIGYRCPLDDCGGEVELIGHYLTGADWARKADYTVIITWRTDVKPARLVAFERTGRRPWPVMVGRYEERVTRYPGQAAHDGTGLGDVIDGYLTVGAESVIMVGRTRSDMLSQYISAIERGELVAPQIAFMRTEHRFASVDDVYGKGHLPDSIAAGALAWAAREGELLLGFV